jgi:hypothetical protein
MSKLYSGQPIDIEITCTVQEPGSMSTATGAKIAYRKPTGVAGEWNAAVNTTTGVVSYSATVSDIDSAGEWRLQPVVTFAGGRTIPGATVVMGITRRFE